MFSALRLPVVDECGFESCCDDGGVGAGNYNKSGLTTFKAACVAQSVNTENAVLIAF